MRGNVIIGQSGGPTAVMNAGLVGIYQTAKEFGVEKVYGMVHGVQGLIQGRTMDLDDLIHDRLDIELMKRTPAAALGTCRYMLPEIAGNEAVYEKIFGHLDDLGVTTIFYIGGNDSMDTVQKLYNYATLEAIDIQIIGVPQTIDNDLAVTDHSPGFGSAAKYIATVTKEVIRDGLGYDQDSVTVMEFMGRNAGWLTGASALARGEDCEGPDLIYLPEIRFDPDQFLHQVSAVQQAKRSVILAVAEGLRLADGTYLAEHTGNVIHKDAFGNILLTGVANHLANLITNELGLKTRPVSFSTLQRSASHITSRVDVTESFIAGAAAVRAAEKGENGIMITLVRTSTEPYQCATANVHVREVARVEKFVPRDWINDQGTGVTQTFIDYVKPLIQGELSPIMVDGMPRHLYYQK